MKKLLIAAIALIFVACGNNSSDNSSSATKDSSTTKKTTPKEEAVGLTLNTAKEVKKGYEVQPIGGKASFEIDVQDGKNFVTLKSGKAVMQKSMD